MVFWATGACPQHWKKPRIFCMEVMSHERQNVHLDKARITWLENFNLDNIDVVVRLLDQHDPERRKRILSNGDAFLELCRFMQSGSSWRLYTPVINPRISVWTFYKRIRSWNEKGVLTAVYQALLRMYSEAKLSRNPAAFKETYIDSSYIKNIGGIDVVGKNPTDRGRNATKLSAVVDDSMVPLSLQMYPANTSDINTMIPAYEQITCKLRNDNRRTVNVIGDKAYSSKHTTEELKKSNFYVITPLKRLRGKKGQPSRPSPKKLSAKHKQLLHNRHRIENFFCMVDKFKHVLYRVDKSIGMFVSLHNFIACVKILRVASGLKLNLQ